MLWYKFLKFIYFCCGFLLIVLDEVIIDGYKCVLIVIDCFLFNNGYVDQIIFVLKVVGVEMEVFFEVEVDLMLIIVCKGVDLVNFFKLDVIIVLGGGFLMDVVKIMWVMYEYLEIYFEELVLCFMDICKCIYKFLKMGVKVKMVVIIIIFGIGFEVMLFVVVIDDVIGQKYLLVDYVLILDMVIVDVNLVMDMLKLLCVFGGLDVVIYVLEVYVFVLVFEFFDGQVLQVLKLLKEYLLVFYYEGFKNLVVCECVYSVVIIVGIVFVNVFFGVCYLMVYKLGFQFYILYGLVNVLLICNVICYNVNDNLIKQIVFSQYDCLQVCCCYVEIVDYLGFFVSGDCIVVKIEKLLVWLESIKVELGILKFICEVGVQEVDFLVYVDKLFEDVFDDQCIGVNLCYLLIFELKQILLDIYYGCEFVEGEVGVKVEVVLVKVEKKVKKFV